MKPSPINIAEAIIEPFWDSKISELAQWDIHLNEGAAAHVTQHWAMVGFEWARGIASHPAITCHRRYPEALVVDRYDQLLVSLVAPPKTTLIVRLETDKGALEQSFLSPENTSAEHPILLQGATRLLAITLEFYCDAEAPAFGWINWIGLANTNLLDHYLEQWNRFDKDWEGYLQPASHQPDFSPTYEVIISKDRLQEIQGEYKTLAEQGKTSPLVEEGEKYRHTNPEDMIREYVRFWDDTRFCRTREQDVDITGPCFKLAMAAAVKQDSELLRLALRYGLSLYFSEHWDDSFITNFTPGPFEHRCFVASLVLLDLSILLDLAGDMLTDIAKEAIMKKMMKIGLGDINFNIWKYDYIYENNQLSWFTEGRLAAYAILSKEYPRITPYMELARGELEESMNHVILRDGGTEEGPIYFMCQPDNGLMGLFYYAQAKGIPFRDVIPASITRTADYGEMLYSTKDTGGFYPICDSGDHAKLKGLAILAYAMPESYWVTIFRKELALTGGSEHLVTWQLEPEIPATGPAPQSFLHLPEIGYMRSLRRHANQEVTLFLMGNRANAGHTHEDKGSFLLEYAEDCYAMDSGTCAYGDSFSWIAKQAHVHNMLIPIGVTQRPHPQNPLPFDVKPQGQGDETSFHAKIDLTQGWEGFYKKWVRSFVSDTPETLAIEDAFELEQGTGVEFLWHTPLAVEILSDCELRIQGRTSHALITHNGSCDLRSRTLPNGVTQNIIAIVHHKTVGTSVINVTFASEE